MLTGTCPEDGYPRTGEQSLGGEIHWTCENPCHPYDPGACPVCRFLGPHVQARSFYGEPDLVGCRVCGAEWTCAAPP